MPRKPKGKKPGPKKGRTKPPKRRLDLQFGARLKAAMIRRQFFNEDTGQTQNAVLVKEVECSHAVIGQYMNEKNPKTNIDAILLLKICDELSVTPFWLVNKEGSIDDVPLNRYPMQDERKKSPPRRRRVLVEEEA